MNNFDYFGWIILPILIFLSRIGDVTLATLRNIFISKGFKHIVPFIGFFEVMIWLIAMRQVFSHLNNPICYIGWAGGFSMGTYIGMRIDERLALGMQMLRIITSQHSAELISALKAKQHGLTIIDGHGAMGPVKIIFTVVKRKQMKEIIGTIHKNSPNAFYSVEDVRNAKHGVFVDSDRLSIIRNLFPLRKGK